jgi:hypothetical protein
MRRTRILTEEEKRQVRQVVNEQLDAAFGTGTIAMLKRKIRRRRSKSCLTIEQALALKRSVLGRDLTDDERLEVVNDTRKQWGFPPVKELLGEE